MTKTVRTRTTHGLANREALDKIFLLAAGIIGVGGGLALKALATPLLLPAIFSAGVLVVYVLLTWAIGQIKLEPETIGDNCYYLGFIFTLSSLAYTLYGLSAAPENVALVANIVSGFGVALSSTIVGVMMRVFLLQFRPDMVAKDRETRITLQAASRDYRTALGQSSNALKQFSLEIQQKLIEHHEHLRIETSKALDGQRSRIEEQTKRSGEMLHKATAESVQKALENVDAMAQNSAKRLEETTQESAERTRKFLESFVNELSQAVVLLNEQMTELAQTGSEAGSTLAESVKGVRVSTEHFQNAMEKLSVNIEGAVPKIEASAKSAASAMTNASESYSEKLEEIAKAIDPTHLNTALVAHDARLQKVSDSLLESARISKNLESGVAQAVAAITSQDLQMKRVVDLLDKVEAPPKLATPNGLPSQRSEIPASPTVRPPEQAKKTWWSLRASRDD